MAPPEKTGTGNCPSGIDMLRQHGFDFASRVKAPFPNYAPLIRAIMENGLMNGHPHPSMVVKELVVQEGDVEARTNDGIPVRKTVDEQGNITIEAGEGFDSAVEHHPSGDLPLGMTISKAVGRIREALAEREDKSS